jgi:pyruvate,water dikinase
MSAVVWFRDLGAADLATAGGKGANLGELAGGGFPVPPGFVVTADGYLEAMDEGGVRADLAELFLDARQGADDPSTLASAAQELRALVRKAGVPPGVARDVLDAYHRLGADVPVAVRSSAIGEDTAGTSFAGMHETFANVVGDDAVLERLVDCWASLYGERVIAYRAGRGITDEPVIAVVVQQLVDADRSGVMFTADPATSDRDRMVIEAAFGLGEVVVGGEVQPDTYVVAKSVPRVLEVRVGQQSHVVARAP